MKYMRIILIIVVTIAFLGCTHKEPSPNLEAKVEELKSRLDTENRGDITVKLGEDNETIDVSFENDILFELGKYKIKSEFKETLGEISTFLVENPKFGVLIEGHTDSTGEAEYNQKLSENRANAVKSLFSSFNIADNRMITVGYGEEQPKYDNSSEEDRRKNRRAEIKIKENIKDLIQGKQFIGETVVWDYSQKVKGGICVGFFFMEFCSNTEYYTFKYKGIVQGVNGKGDCRVKITEIDGLNQLSSEQRSMVNLSGDIGKVITKRPSNLTKVFY